MIGRALPFHFCKNTQVLEIGSFPRSKRYKNLQPVACGVNLYLNGAAIIRRFHESGVAGRESALRQFITGRGVQLDRSAGRGRYCIRQRIEGDRSGSSKSRHDFRTCDKGMCARISVIPARKISVVCGDNGIFFSHHGILSFPLSDAWPACICKNRSAKIGQRF